MILPVVAESASLNAGTASSIRQRLAITSFTGNLCRRAKASRSSYSYILRIHDPVIVNSRKSNGSLSLSTVSPPTP